MEPGPLPPHERPWRHPSEIAAATRHDIRTERPSGAVRAAALVGGTTTAVLMGLLVLTLTPERIHGPTVTGSVPIQDDDVTARALVEPLRPDRSATTPDRSADAEDAEDAGTHDAGQADPAGPAPSPTTVPTEGADEAEGPPLATLVALDGTAVAPSALVLARMSRPTSTLTRSGPIIERISRDRLSVGPVNPQVEVVLGDGSVTTAQVLDPGDGSGLAIIRLPRTAAEGAHGVLVPTAAAPGADSWVTVLSPEPVLMRLADLLAALPADRPVSSDDLPYPDGTPVLDEYGRLIGVLTCNDEGMQLTPVVLAGGVPASMEGVDAELDEPRIAPDPAEATDSADPAEAAEPEPSRPDPGTAEADTIEVDPADPEPADPERSDPDPEPTTVNPPGGDGATRPSSPAP